MRTMAAAAALVSVAVIVHARQEPQLPSFHSESSELVVLPVTVADRGGQPVPNLPRERFVVYDNGRRQAISLFSNQDTPVTIGLVVDNSGSMRAKMGEVVAATAAFARASNPDDEIFALAFNDSVRSLLGDRALSAEDASALSTVLASLRPDGKTSMYDGLAEGLRRISEGTRARKVLILISDGGDNASHTTLKEVLNRARLSSVTVYTIGIFDGDDPDSNPRILKAIAEATGGERFLPRSPGPLLGVCAHIAREIRAGYTIGYIPPDHDGTYHHVRVEVDTRGGPPFLVRARPGYFAGGQRSRPSR
jgi:Ca-activated chloride channel homolog